MATHNPDTPLPETAERNTSTPSGHVPDELLPYVPTLQAAHHRKGDASFRFTLFGICLTFFLLLFWAAFAELDEVVAGGGQVIPSQRVQHIQNLEGGILREVLVSEGQMVERGDLLLRIDNEQAGSIYRDAVTKNLELQATVARLEAELSEGEPRWPEHVRAESPTTITRHANLLVAERTKTRTTGNTLRAQLELRQRDAEELLSKRSSLQASLALAARQRDLARKLLAARSFSEMEYLRLEQQVTSLQGELSALESTIPKSQAAIREAEERLKLFQAETTTGNLQKLNQATTELASLRELLTAGADRVTRTEVRSPVRGLVKSIKITTAGGVIMPGEVIMDVVPVDDSLIVEARVSPQDIAFLFIGQKAKVRLTSYDFAIYGALDATLEHISADTIEGKQGEVFYLVKLRTSNTALRYHGRDLPILPGMMATADIMTGKKTVLDYIIKPIMKAKQTALRER